MGLTWIEDVEPDIQRLGLDNPFKLRAFVQAEEIRVRVRDRQLDRLANLIQDTTQVVVEKCDSFVIRPSVEGVDWPTDRNAEILNRAKERYKLYLNTCEKMLNKAVEAQSGALVTARANLESAKSALDKKARDVKIATADVKKARQDHKQAIIAAAAAGKRGEELRIAIKESADNLKSKIDQASTLAPSIVTTERISGIVALLEAAASDRVDLAAEDTPNENLAEAILLVNGISSLASDIATIVAKAEAPSISNLLIELQHQVVLLEYAQALERMEQEKVAILEAKYLAHKEEAVELLSFHDALCTFGIRTADGQHPGIACNGFSVTEKGKVCSIDGAAVPKCRLTRTWKYYLSKPPSGDAGREFYKALTAFNRLFSIRASQIENNFRLIDLEHRKNLAAREMALKAWNNLVAVPIDQLDAFYGSGLKPAEIADFLVKALGLTAIAVGVSE